MSGEIGVRMHGVKLNLRCDNDEQLVFTSQLLGDHVCAPWELPDLEVQGTWLTPEKGADIGRPLFDLSGLDAFGKRMHLADDKLVWTDTYRNKNLQLRFGLRGSVHTFDVAYQFRPSIKKADKYPDYEHKKYFDLVRYLVVFPVAWHLRRTRGWELIHASAVADGDRGVLIAGPGGAGKTTTCVALVAHAGMRLLTENLVFCDGDHIYPVCEPIRLTDESLELLGDAASQLKPLGPPGGLKHKTMYLPDIDPDPPGVRPAVVFLARFSDHGFVRPIPPAVACEQIRSTNLLTLELNDFYWYAAALDLIWPRLGTSAEEPIHRLTTHTPCHALGIDRSAGVGPVVDQILECLRGRMQPALEESPR